MKARVMKIDKFHYHEALDRAALVSDIFYMAFNEHPIINKHKKLKKLSNELSERLGDFYQEIGKISYKK
jgi:hypothetical protein